MFPKNECIWLGNFFICTFFIMGRHTILTKYFAQTYTPFHTKILAVLFCEMVMSTVPLLCWTILISIFYETMLVQIILNGNMKKWQISWLHSFKLDSSKTSSMASSPHKQSLEKLLNLRPSFWSLMWCVHAGGDTFSFKQNQSFQPWKHVNLVLLLGFCLEREKLLGRQPVQSSVQ